MRILLFPSVAYLDYQILKPSTSTKLGQLLSVPSIVIQNHVIKSHKNKNQAILSKRMNLFPCSVNVRFQFVLKTRAQIEVDSTVVNRVFACRFISSSDKSHRLDFTVVLLFSVNIADVGAFLLSLFDESNVLKSPMQEIPIRKCLVQLIKESLFSLTVPLIPEMFYRFFS